MSIRDELTALVNLPPEDVETLLAWVAEHDEKLVEELIRHVDSTPAVTWTGKGGVKDRIQTKYLQR